jgi:hypothetical protein
MFFVLDWLVGALDDGWMDCSLGNCIYRGFMIRLLNGLL